ncbi:MAG: class IV adenylate cyclase [Thermoanaerobaculia bacterium]|jgi:adenylate cyclase class 2
MHGPREIETKFRVDGRRVFEARLWALGAAPGPAEAEFNVLFDDAAHSLRETGCALRVRSVDGRGLLTFKGPAEVVAGVKSRVEWESAVASPEAVSGVLSALGYRPWFRYEKRRATWRFEDPARPVVVLDETPLGLFAEIEGTDPAVRALATELGVAGEDLIGESYVALWLAARAKDPSLPFDMVFERP